MFMCMWREATAEMDIKFAIMGGLRDGVHFSG